MAAQTRKSVAKKIAKSITDICDSKWSRKDQARVAITVDGIFVATYNKEAVMDVYKGDRFTLDMKAFLEQRFHLQCDNLEITVAWIPGKEKPENVAFE